MSKVLLGVASFSGNNDYLEETLDSLREQSFKDHRIVVDDDEEKNVWNKWSDFIVSAEEEYIALPGGDDVYLPNWLESCVEFLDENLDCVAVFTLDYKIDHKSDRLDGGIVLPFDDKKKYDFNFIFRNMLKFGNFLSFPSGVYRTSMLKDFRFVIDEKIGGASDTFGYFQMMAPGHKIGIINKQLYKNRIHDKQYSHAQRGEVPIDHFYAMDAASKLVPGIRTWDVHIILSRHLEENDVRAEFVRLKNKANDAKKTRILICHEPPGKRSNGTGILVGQRAIDFNKKDDEWITYFLFPDTSKRNSVINKTIYEGVPCVICPPELLEEAVKRYNPDEIEIHHTIRWTLQNMLFLFGDLYLNKTKLYLHDAHLWCAMYHLMNSKGERCDGPTPEKCSQCIGIDKSMIAKGLKSTAAQINKIKEIYANSPWLQEHAQTFFGRQISLYNWPLPPLPEPFRGKKVLFFGNFLPVKGIRQLLEASRILTDVQFILFGDMPEEFRDGRRVFGMPNVLAMGRYNRDELPALTNLGDLVVVPSLQESWGMVAREAARTGIPVVATNAGGLADIGTVEPGNIEALVEAINKEIKR